MESPAADSPVATAVQAIHSGDLALLEKLLRENPSLATARIDGRTLLHVATDWPGCFPNSGATVAMLVAHGADVNAAYLGRHSETPLHWAASTDDVSALDALLDHGAQIEAPGAVIGGGTPLADAVAFAQWQAAALGLMSRVEEFFKRDSPLTPGDITNAFWSACLGSQLPAAQYLLDRGADLNWVGYERLTPLDVAIRNRAGELIQWLRDHGARPANELN